MFLVERMGLCGFGTMWKVVVVREGRVDVIDELIYWRAFSIIRKISVVPLKGSDLKDIFLKW